MISIPLVISDIEKITSDSVQITFDIPENQKLNFDFFAGQYVTLETEIKGENLRRAYSICSAPNEKKFSVAIKQIPEGKFSTFANNNLQKGQTINVFPPEGKFAYISEIYSENLMLIAAGSGITPILSIIKVALHNTKQKILLIYGNKTKNSTMFLSELDSLISEFPDRFFVQYIFSQAHEKNALFGRIDSTIIRHLLKSKYKDLDFQRFYICGPQAMVQMAKQTLAEGYDSKKIHTELFIVEDTPQKTYEGSTTITIHLNGVTEIFDIQRSKPILDSLLEHDLDVSYSCRGGVCSSCLSKITEGQAEMVKNQILSEAEINNGLILTCQAHATTDTLTLDYDNI